MVHDLKLSRDDCPVTYSDKEHMDQYPFRSTISSLIFSMIAMRVGISYAVTSVARFTANPGMPQWVALVCIFQYLKGTSDMKLAYSRVCDTPAPSVCMDIPTQIGQQLTSMRGRHILDIEVLYFLGGCCCFLAN